MARRRMTNDREDSYNSRRDYQSIHDRRSTIAIPKDADPSRMTFKVVADGGNTDFIGFGGYVRPNQPCRVTIRLATEGSVHVRTDTSLTDGWNRLGLAIAASAPCRCTAILDFSEPQSHIEGWGINFDSLTLPDKVLEKDLSAEDLSQNHLAPETFYLPTSAPPFATLDDPGWAKKESKPGAIKVKKCAYCRYLPLTPESPGRLAFHKHSSKVTDHQNECRACKKWRINDELNDLRTADQFHESSTISRERRILLREPEILQRIKEKYGQGLKSLVWERFNRECFNCGTNLRLKEVQLDHTRPLAYLWPIDEHATCLCSLCNNQKGDKFPIEFYSSPQLRNLSEITDLPLKELRRKDVNPTQLRRIKANIEKFAKMWSPITLNAINRKVVEMRPKESLLEILKNRNPTLHLEVTQELNEAREW